MHAFNVCAHTPFVHLWINYFMVLEYVFGCDVPCLVGRELLGPDFGVPAGEACSVLFPFFLSADVHSLAAKLNNAHFARNAEK